MVCDFTTLVDVLRARALETPDSLGYVFLDRHDSEPISLTYGELDRRARLAGALLTSRTTLGSRAVLVFPPGIDFIVAFFACLYAGVIAVPVVPPLSRRHRSRLQSVMQDAETQLVLTTPSLRVQLETIGIDWLTLDNLVDDFEATRVSQIVSESVAYLQYTSGSTAMPKGVVITHANVLANLSEIVEGFDYFRSDVSVSWLPHFHDMGLVLGIIEPMFHGMLGVLMAPTSFLQRPVFWLEAISRFRGTWSGAPNFAYDLCVEKISPEQRDALDLRSWRVATVGAEPVRAETLARFAAAFSPHGFNAAGFRPGYGMAEATLKIATVTPPNIVKNLLLSKNELQNNNIVDAVEGDPDPHSVVGCGHAGTGVTILIVRPDSLEPCQAMVAGEIWVSGPSIGSGYWNKLKESQYTFGARLSTGEGPFLRTGDLGFLREGELFVTGRLKDLIVIRGRNYYPQDIEQAARDSHPALSNGIGAAFSIEKSGEERLVVIHEIERVQRKNNLQQVIQAMPRSILDRTDLQPYSILLVRPGTVPRTSSGKIRRSACRELYVRGELDALATWAEPQEVSESSQQVENTALLEPNASAIQYQLKQMLGRRLGISPAKIDVHESFAYFGFDSKKAVAFTAALEKEFERKLPATVLYEYPNISALAGMLAGDVSNSVPSSTFAGQHLQPAREPIAITGIGCRFPNAASVTEFWKLLCDGLDPISEVPSGRWDVDQHYTSESATSGKMNTRWGGWLNDIELFDASFFGVSGREASRMDPQQRLLLEVCWEALEDAGEIREELAGSRTGVFVGIANSDYARMQQGELSALNAYATTGSALSIAANRLSYFFDWRGPSMAIDTACSSSLVAVNAACRSLWTGESDLAIAAGVNVILSPSVAIDLTQGGLMSPDGRCKVFDEKANGYVRSEGVGLVVLKPLSRALADGDRVYCTIRGVAVNQDGHSNGLMAPNRMAQEDLLRAAWEEAGAHPNDAVYVEAHGTGTLLGDPIEAAAIAAVMCTERKQDDRCLIGSVKSNIGHTEAAAGIAGLIKVALSLSNSLIPANLHFEQPNPNIAFEKLQLEVVRRNRSWPEGARRLVGVSSFGFGGTNAHVVVEGFDSEPAPLRIEDRPQIYLLPLSAGSPTALKATAARHLMVLSSISDRSSALNDICYTAARRRTHHACRLAVSGNSQQALIDGLNEFVVNPRQQESSEKEADKECRAVFAFSGSGSQWLGMGAELFAAETTFRQTIEECEENLRSHVDWSLVGLLSDRMSPSYLLEDVAQPALVCIQIALAAVWRKWGIEPAAVVGHSLGEIAAAHIAGVLSLKDALRIVCGHSSAIASLSGRGGMLLLSCPIEEAERLAAAYKGHVVVAVESSPIATILSGDSVALAEIGKRFQHEGRNCKSMDIPYPWHSPMLDPLREKFIKELSGLCPGVPRIPMYSTTTGDLAQGLTYDARYWWANFRETVRFAPAISSMIRDGYNTFLEVSVNPVLGLSIQECAQRKGQRVITLPSLDRNKSDLASMLASLAQLYSAGANIRWHNVLSRGHHVPLPSYPFERQRFWFPNTQPQSVVALGSERRDEPVPQPANESEATEKSCNTENKQAVLETLSTVLARQMEIEPGSIDVHAPLVDMGADSIVLAETTAAIWDRFAVDLDIRQLFETHTTLNVLAEHIASVLDQRQTEIEPLVPSITADVVTTTTEPASLSSSVSLEQPKMNGGRYAVVQQQLELLSQVILEQLQILRSSADAPLVIPPGADDVANDVRDNNPNCSQHNSVDRIVAKSQLQESSRGMADEPQNSGFSPEEEASPTSDNEVEVSRETLGEFPLTKAQAQVAFLSQMSTVASAAWNVTVAVAWEGAVRLPVLRSSFQMVVSRHEALRTVFDFEKGMQTVLESSLCELSVIDVSEVHDSWQGRLIQSCFLDESRQCFDLGAGPLLRVRVIRVADGRHVLVVSAHHISIDGGSMSRLVDEMFCIYVSLCATGKQPVLDEPSQFREYARRQRQQAHSIRYAKSEEYWLTQFDTEVPPLTLPIDRPRPFVKSYFGAQETVVLDHALLSRLKRFCKDRGYTAFMMLLAGFFAFLHRVSGQDDLVVGVPMADRNWNGSGIIIGFCINTLPVRHSFRPNISFIEHMASVRAVLLDGIEHARYSSVDLVENLALRRNNSRASLFDVTFNLNHEGKSFDVLKGKTRIVPRSVLTSRRDIEFNAIEVPEGLLVEVMYSTDLFGAETIRRFASYWERLLESAVEDPDQLVGSLEMLSSVERSQLLYGWNGTEAEEGAGGVLDWIWDCVEAHPDAIAVSEGVRQLSYGGLRERAGRLARELEQRGVGREVRVGVYLNRSQELVIALLGVLESGGVYVPLDPGYPSERLKYMASDAGVSLTVTEGRLRSEVPAPEGEMLYLEEVGEEGEWGRRGEGILRRQLAYVLYTSGSTGQPKGAMIEHRGLCNHVRAKVEELELGSGEGVAQNAPSSFDISVWQMLSPLVSGGRVEVIGEEEAGDSERLLESVARRQVAVVETVPTMLTMMVEQQRGKGEGKRKLESLRWLVCNAEALPVGLCREWSELYPEVGLINTYGATECSDDVTHYRVEEAIPDWMGYAPLGKPLRNSKVYVVDGNGEPSPVGVRGEVLIGGAGVGRGYLNRCGMTASRFVPDPFGEGTGERLYRTGDLGRWRGNGELEFLGRADDQVKIRGYRVELGEVEAKLLEHAGVGQAVVVVREDTPGDKRLVAYCVTAADGDTLGAEQLREYLSSCLPEYMVPGAYVLLESFPLTVNGKVDRKALPAPAWGAGSGEGYEGRRTPVEEILAGIWSEVLKVEAVGRQDNFFSLGGHSLLATQVMSRVRNALHVEVPLRWLFESPVLSAFVKRIEGLGEGEAKPAPSLMSWERRDRLPLSYAQQRLWFIDQLEPGSSTYNAPSALRMHGPLDVWSLGKSFAEIVRRHEVLRTVFVVAGGEAEQRIEAAGPVALPVVELSNLKAQQREAVARRLVQYEAARPFDLEHGPLLRLLLLRLGEQEHVLSVNLHHIVTDGWSTGILVREFMALYESFCKGSPSPLAELGIQYADYAGWQREWLQGEVLEGELDYWRTQLAGLEPLELPTDHPRPAVASRRGGLVSFSFTEQQSRAVRALSRREGVTVFMVLLASWKVLLSRYSGQKDFAVGTDVANRNRLETEGLIGFFVNQLVLREDLEGVADFRGLLARTRQTTLEAYGHQDVPFERLVEELSPERSLGRAPLFQVKLILQNAPGEELEMSGVRLEGWGGEHRSAKFDLTLIVQEDGEEIAGGAEYATDLYERSTVERMLGHWERLLESAVESPECRIEELEMLSSAEREQLLVEWNDTALEYPQELCVHELFEGQAEQRPEAVAVMFEEASLSYGELNRRSNRVAHSLRRLGVGPEVRVGLCLERSLEMVVAILGVLKAGGAYVPLDPAYPIERLSYMVADTAPAVLLTQKHLRELFGEFSGPVLELDAGAPEWADEPQTNLDRGELLPEHLAYVIYTSGSTGQPKGVMVPHANVARLFRATEERFQFSSADTWTLFHSYAFDFSVWELWGALIYGGRLVVVTKEIARSGEEFYRLLSRERITILNQTPSAFRQLMLVQARASEAHQLRRVIFGGEELDPTALRPWYEHNREGGPQLVNMYGITETTVHVSYRRLEEADTERGGSSPIGRCISGMQAYVLDEEMAPVPVGVSGELYVGGAGLARGYLNRAGQTAERFVPSLYGTEAGERLYRTGDKVRWRNDGNLEFLGRNDDQVKIRGYRIELGEIQAKLLEHAGVGQAVVVVREDTPGDRRLVAYYTVVEREEQIQEELGAEDLRLHLSSRLPEYMVPKAYVLLKALPLTGNGKVDRKALPAPEWTSGEEYEAPQPGKEEVLAEIWADVLGLERVGRHDNFFALGGDSILSIRIISRARQAGLNLTVRQLFQHQTVANLTAIAGEDATMLSPQVHVSGVFTATPIQAWFLQQERIRPWHYNQSILLAARTKVQGHVLESAMQALVEHHDILRLRCVEGQLQIAEREVNRVWMCVDLNELPVEQQGKAFESVAGQVQASLNLERGPGMRGVWVKGGGGERLLMVIHHLGVDGVSWRILLEDLEAGYSAAARGIRIELPAKTSSYPQWAEALTRYAESAEVAEQETYWQSILEWGTARLPKDMEGGHNVISSAETEAVEMSEEETRSLLQHLPKLEGAGLQEGLLLALEDAVCRWTGERRVLVEVEGHGREEVGGGVDVGRTVGWFTAMYPVLLERRAGGLLGARLQELNRRMKSIPGKGLGYGLLRYMKAESRLRGLTGPEIVFNYLGQFEEGRDGAGMWAMVAGASGSSENIEELREHVLEIGGAVRGGQLRLWCCYSREIHRRSTIVSLLEDMVVILRKLLREGESLTSKTSVKLALTSSDLNVLAQKIIVHGGRD